MLLLPALVLWRQDNTLFTGAHYIDPWVYFGFFQNLKNFNHDIFPATYYGSRLSWILPGYLIHSVLSPVAASAILHLLVQSVAAVSLFTVLRTFTGLRAAFLTTMLFSANQWVWAATGWDYVDGAGIAYWLLTLALLTRAVASPRGDWLVLCAGVFAAATVYSNLFWISLVPVLPIYYVALMWATGRSLWRAIAGFCIWAGAGAAALTGVLVAISYQVNGYYWFYAPSIQFAQRLADKNPWFESVWGSNGLEAWLWFPVIGILAALWAIPLALRDRIGRTRVPVFVLSFQLLFGAAVFGCFQFTHRVAVLGLFYYASYLLPAVFLVLGVAFWQSLEKLNFGLYVSLCCVAAAAFAAVWSDFVGHRFPIWPAHNTVKVVAGSLALLAALTLRKTPVGNFLAILGLFIFTFSARLLLHPDPHLHRHELERIMRLRNRVEAVRKNGPIHFWFNEHDPDALDYVTLNSTYVGGWSWLPNFPQGGCQERVYAGSLMVIESRLANSTTVALNGLASCWQRFGLTPTLLSVETAQRSDQPYTMSLIKAETQSSLLRPLRIVTDPAGKPSLQVLSDKTTAEPFPLSGWSLIRGGGGSMRRFPDGSIETVTPTARYAPALEYSSLVPPASGRYQFTLRYIPRSGFFSFGARTQDGAASEQIGSNGSSYLDGRERELALWINLKQGQAFELRIANNNDFTDRAASIVVDHLTAAFIPSAAQ